MDPESFSGELLQTFREEIILNLHKFSQKTEAEGILPKAFYEAPWSKTDKGITRKLKTSIPCEDKCKNSKHLSKSIPF